MTSPMSTVTTRTGGPGQADRRSAPPPWAGLGRSTAWPLLVYGAALLLTFGFEIFSFNLTIDEESAGVLSAPGYAVGWLEQGRWAMGAITLLLPNPVVPVVSTGLGVGLSGVAWWLMCRRTLGMRPWMATMAASLVATVPIFIYLYSFSTIAYGIGIGALLAVGYAEGISSASWRYRIAGLAAGAAAIGVYDTFVAVLAAFAVVVVLRRPTFLSAVWALASVGAAFVASRVVGLIASWVFRAPQGIYGSQLVDLQGFVAHPLSRSLYSLDQVWQVLSLQPGRVGLHSPYLAITVIALAAAALVAALTTRGAKARLLTVLAVLALIAIPYGAQAVAPVAVPLRSMIYIPAVVLVLMHLAAGLLTRLPLSVRRSAIGVLGALVILSVLGDAAISNRMSAAAATSLSHDQELAFEIGQQIELQTHADPSRNLALVVSGAHGWTSTVVTPVQEQLGASFFAWDGGSANRIAAFLYTQGVVVRPGSVADSQTSRAALERMPNYPAPGWIAVRGDLLLLKFGPRTAYQP